MTALIAISIVGGALVGALGATLWFAPRKRELEGEVWRLEGSLRARVDALQRISVCDNLSQAKGIAKTWYNYGGLDKK